MTGTRETGQPWYARAYLSVGIREVLFPIDIDRLLMLLPQLGYALQRELPRTRPLGTSIQGQLTDFARKGDFSLDVNSDRGYLGVNGPDPSSVVEEFEAINGFLQSSLGFSVEKHAAFYEFLAQGTLQTAKSPLVTFGKISPKFPVLQELEATFNHRVGLYGMHLVNPEDNPNSPEWFDLNIEPAVHQADQCYLFTIVFRQPTLEPVVKFAGAFTSLLTRLVARLEGN